MSDFDPQLFGQNVRKFRALRGYSMRDLARLAGVSLKTIENIEGGNGCRAPIEERVASALRTVPGRLWKDGDSELHSEERVVRALEGRWYFVNQEQAHDYHLRSLKSQRTKDLRFRSDPERIQNESERLSLGYIGASVGFFQNKSGTVQSGHHLTCLVELFGKDTQAADPQGHTYQIHVLHGVFLFNYRDRTSELSEGDIVVLVESAPFSMEPMERIKPGMRAPRFLITRLAMLGPDRRRRPPEEPG